MTVSPMARRGRRGLRRGYRCRQSGNMPLPPNILTQCDVVMPCRCVADSPGRLCFGIRSSQRGTPATRAPPRCLINPLKCRTLPPQLFNSYWLSARRADSSHLMSAHHRRSSPLLCSYSTGGLFSNMMALTTSKSLMSAHHRRSSPKRRLTPPEKPECRPRWSS